MTSSEVQIQERYECVLEQIEKAARSAGRGLSEVRLVVVTKTHPPETVRAVIGAGARWLGENYAEEGIEKMKSVSEMGIGTSDIEWHMIGHVQSRKAASIVTHYSLLHSLDSVKLAQRLERFAGDQERKFPVLLQLNVSGEESKSGFPAWDAEHENALYDTVEQLISLPHLEIQGLMAIPPFLDDPEQVRPYFRKLRQWLDGFAQRFSQVHWRELSIGMSNDFEVAIQEGATLVRIGTAILGARPLDARPLDALT